MPAGGFAAVMVGDGSRRTPQRVAVKPLMAAVKPLLLTVELALLAGLHPLDRAAGPPPCLLPLLVVVVTRGRHSEGTVGVVNLESLAVVLDQAGRLPPRPPPPHRLRDRAERRGEVGGLFQLGDGDPLG
jgi:hypothetical protein